MFAGLAVIIAPTNNDQAPRPSLPRSMQANALPRSALAQRMVESTDPLQTAMLRKEIVRGFYGGKPHA